MIDISYEHYLAVLANGICGFALTLALLFSIQDEQAAVVAENGGVEVVRDFPPLSIHLTSPPLLIHYITPPPSVNTLY